MLKLCNLALSFPLGSPLHPLLHHGPKAFFLLRQAQSCRPRLASMSGHVYTRREWMQRGNIFLASIPPSPRSSIHNMHMLLSSCPCWARFCWAIRGPRINFSCARDATIAEPPLDSQQTRSLCKRKWWET